MYRKLKGSVSKFGVVLLAMGVLGGCAAESSGGSGATATGAGATASSAPAATAAPTAGMTATAAAVTLVPPAPELSEVDVNLDQLQWMIREWNIDVDDPAAVAEESSAVLTGTVVRTDGTSLGSSGDIYTYYTIRVDKVYKGDLKVGDEISVSLPGGTMLTGEYIDEVERLGLTERVLPPRSENFDPKAIGDPRDNDPNTPITDNWGSNPTSESLNAEIAPDAWVYFLNRQDDGTYYGSFAHHSFKYLKDGYIHSLHPEPEPGQTVEPFPEAELVK